MSPTPNAGRHRDNRRRARRAAILVPLALVSGSWTTFLLGGATATSDASSLSSDGVVPPAAPIDAPASLPTVRRPPAGVPARAASVRDDGIPAVALSAYQRAAAVIDAADDGCHLRWPLLAAIGRVESDHGRHAGGQLSEDGVARPSIFGPLLDGRRGTTRIADTDGGLFDRSTALDRAVGPMQFIPSTWLIVGVDGDGDQQRDPQDIDDAALAAAVYLCSGEGDLSAATDAGAAVYRYNHSASYVGLVMRIAREYAVEGYASRAYSAYAPILPDLGYHPTPTPGPHQHHPASDVTSTDPHSDAIPPSTQDDSPEDQPTSPPADHEPSPAPDGQESDPLTQLVTSVESTVSDVLDEPQDLPQIPLPTP
jgi:hypothetical protein